MWRGGEDVSKISLPTFLTFRQLARVIKYTPVQCSSVAWSLDTNIPVSLLDDKVVLIFLSSPAPSSQGSGLADPRKDSSESDLMSSQVGADGLLSNSVATSDNWQGRSKVIIWLGQTSDIRQNSSINGFQQFQTGRLILPQLYLPWKKNYLLLRLFWT